MSTRTNSNTEHVDVRTGYPAALEKLLREPWILD